jgi:hypothetical protein
MTYQPQPRYPILIVSKGRWLTQQTSGILSVYGVPHYVVVEEQERELYEAHRTTHATYLTLDPAYQDNYDTCDDLGTELSKGSGPARNFAWDYSIGLGAARHWVMDDNIRGFWRYHQNRQIRVIDAAYIQATEDFVDRYTNVALAGPQYYMFVARKDKYPPYVLNTRLYSCILISNDLDLRWRARFNEDVDLSLRVLKAGWATIQLNAVLQWKMPTQMLAGGNTETYVKAGTKAKSEMLVKLHPDVARTTWKFGRWHHEVDYGPFRRNELIRRPDLVVPDEPNEYGMELVGPRSWPGWKAGYEGAGNVADEAA